MKKFIEINGLGMFIVMLIGALVGSMIITAMPADADSVSRQGSILLKNRYGVTATVDELNKMDGVTATTTELNYVDGVTSAIQTQLDAKGTATLADTKIFVGNSGSLATAVSMSGDATITNAGVVSLAANSVGTSEAFINTVTLLVNAGATTNSVTVDSGHVLMSYYLTTIGGINGTNLVNDVYYDGSGGWTISMVNAVSSDAVWTFKFLSDN
jgi:hypothetical protein